MRILPINKAMSYLAPSLITSGLFISSTLVGMPLQSGLTTTSKVNRETVVSVKSETGNVVKSPVLARNTTAKVDPIITTTSTVPKSQDKKTISRCWKRLMSMVREMNHAHHTKSDGNKQP